MPSTVPGRSDVAAAAGGRSPAGPRRAAPGRSARRRHPPGAAGGARRARRRAPRARASSPSRVPGDRHGVPVVDRRARSGPPSSPCSSHARPHSPDRDVGQVGVHVDAGHEPAAEPVGPGRRRRRGSCSSTRSPCCTPRRCGRRGGAVRRGSHRRPSWPPPGIGVTVPGPEGAPLGTLNGHVRRHTDAPRRAAACPGDGSPVLVAVGDRRPRSAPRPRTPRPATSCRAVVHIGDSLSVGMRLVGLHPRPGQAHRGPLRGDRGPATSSWRSPAAAPWSSTSTTRRAARQSPGGSSAAASPAAGSSTWPRTTPPTSTPARGTATPSASTG